VFVTRVVIICLILIQPPFKIFSQFKVEKFVPRLNINGSSTVIDPVEGFMNMGTRSKNPFKNQLM